MTAKKTKAKKTKSGKLKAKAKTTKASVARSGESKPRLSVANFVRDQLERKVDEKKILEKGTEAFPKNKLTMGYINWIRDKAPKMSTTQNADKAM